MDRSKGSTELLERVDRLTRRVAELEREVTSLRHSEQQFRELFDHAVVGVYRTTPDGRILMANPALVAMLGYSSFEELSGRNLEDKNGFEPAYPRSTFIDAIEKEGKVIQLESAWTTRDGTTVFVSESARAVRGKDGHTLYYEGIVQDITEQKKAREDARSLKQQIEFILGAAKTGLDIIDSDHNIRYIDPEWQKVYGDPTGKRCYEYFMGRTGVCEGCGIPKALATKAVTVTEEVLVRENNRPIQVTAIPFQNDKGEWLVAEVNVDISERKKAEDAIRCQEEMLQAILNATTESIFLLDPEGTILTCNATAARRLGKNVSELIGQKAQDLLIQQAPPEAIRSRLERIRPVLHTAEPVCFEDERQGRIYETSAYPVFDRSGKVVSVAIFGKDITEQRQAERALGEAKLRYQTLFDSAPVGIGIAALDGRMLEGNRMMFQITGYGESDFCGVNVSDIYYEPKQRQQVLQQLREQGSVRDFKIQFKRKDGTSFDASLTVTPLTLAGQDVVMAVVQDISEREKMQAALRESEAILRAVFDATTESVFLIDKKTIFLTCNEIGARRLGTTPKELMGLPMQSLAERFNRHARQQILSRMHNVRRVLSSGKSLRVEDERDGMVFDNHYYPVFGADGKVSSVAVFARDITEQRRAEKALEEEKLRYQSLFENAPVGIGIATRDGRVLECNSTMLRMTGYSGQELQRVNLRKTYLHPEQRRILLERLHREGTVRDFEVQLKRKDGSRYYAIVTVAPLSLGGQDILLTIQSDITERMKMEEALRNSEERLRSVFDVATESILLVDKKMTVVASNKKAADRLGIPLQELVGMSANQVAQRTSPRSVIRSRIQNIREVLFSGKPFRAEDSRKGMILDLHYRPVFDPDGKVWGVAAFARDITEFRRNEQRLRESETKYRTLTSNIPGMVYRGAPDWSASFVTNSKSLCGYTPADFQSKRIKWLDLVYPDDIRFMLQQNKMIMKSPTSVIQEYRITDKAGRIRCIEDHKMSVFTPAGKFIGVDGIAFDITEQKLAERALQESEEKYRVLVEGANECISILDARGEFLFMNRTAIERLGVGVEGYAGKTIWDVFPRKNAERNLAAVREVVRTGRGVNSIAQNVIRGELRWYNTSLEPLRDSKGKTIAAMVIARDIHDYRQAQDELEQYRENMIRAEQLASVGILSASVAHELAQPLTVVRLSMENSLVELKGPPCPTVIAEDLKEGLAAVSTAASIVDRFRNLARKSPGKVVKPVDLAALGGRIAAVLAHSANQARVTIDIKGLAKLPAVRVCENDLEQVFFALTENAIQAAGGKRPRRMTIAGKVKQGHIVLRFTDTCGGIRREHLGKIFEPFFTTKPASQGTGLGLPIVHRIVSGVGGNIRVESRWRKGTTFTIMWPLSPR